MVNRGIDARPDGEDKSTITSDDIVPGHHAAIGTVSAVTPDDDWFNPDLTVQDAPERKDMPRPQHVARRLNGDAEREH
jgi:hypothetical protein